MFNDDKSWFWIWTGLNRGNNFFFNSYFFDLDYNHIKLIENL
jgi:hypothetical protein